MPENLGRYSIVEPIGEGGLGQVFRAVDTSLGRTVAIKLVPDAIASDPARRDRLLRDAKRAANISHPSVAGLIEAGEADGRLFLVFEHVPGERLRAALAGRPLNVRRAIDFAIQLADALAEGHGHGVVHRDLKPDNVLVTAKGRPKLLDFGLVDWTRGGSTRAAAAVLSDESPATAETVAYMSPEQALGEPCDDRTDIFSLGVLLYEMLTGRAPFVGPTPSSTLVQILQATPPPPSSVNTNVPPALDRILSRALAKSLDRRYPGAAMLATELRAVAGALDESQDDAALPRVPATRRGGAARWLVALVVVAVLAGAAWAFRGELRTQLRRMFGPKLEPVVFVAPLEVDRPEASVAALAVGLAEDLASRLAQIPGVTVPGRSSTRLAPGTQPIEAARESGALVLLTGRLLVEGDSVRLEPRLVDLEGATRWSRTYTRDFRELFALMEDAAEGTASALGVKVTGSPSRARARLRQVSRAAYELYIEGRNAASRGEADRAEAFYRQAIEASDQLAEAHAALAILLARRARLSASLDWPVHTRAQQAAERAATSEPDLAEVRLALGMTAWDLRDALSHLAGAVELDPSNGVALHAVGDALAAWDPQRALLFYDRAVALDPGFAESYADRAVVLAWLKQIDEAQREVERGRRRLSGLPVWSAALGRLYLQRGEAATALHWTADPETRPGLPEGLVRLAALEGDGRHDEAEAVVRDLSVRYPQACWPAAYLAALTFDRGREREARAMAERIQRGADTPEPWLTPRGCAATSAAAVADPGRAAMWLSRIAADERSLQAWGVETGELIPEALIRAGWYPWNRVVKDPAVLQALQAIERARAATRAQLPVQLDALLQPLGRLRAQGSGLKGSSGSGPSSLKP